MKKILIFTILAFSLSFSFAYNIPKVNDDDVYQNRNSIANKCSELLKNKQFDELEIFLDKLDNDKELLNSYGHSFTSYCLKQNDSDAVSNWMKERPNSKYAKLSMYQGTTRAWYEKRIEIAFYQPDKKVFFSVLEEASQKYTDYFPIYAIAASNMYPVWGISFVN